MTTAQLLVVGGFELLAILIILRMWVRRHHRAVVRVVWSLVLLVPVIGILAYYFLRESPAKHPVGKGWNAMRSDAECVASDGSADW